MAELHDILLEGIPVAEMEAGVDNYVPLDPKMVAQLTEGDDDPQFPVIKIESGLSQNKFDWPASMLVDIAEQVNRLQPVGYLGHIRPDDDRYAFPPPQTRWLRALTKKEGDKTVLYVKGYNLPDEPIRRYIKLGAVDSVSWKGKAAVQHLKGGVQRVHEFALESIDWSRKGKAAMSARLVTVAAEMEGDGEVAELGKVTVAELQAENPNLVELIKREGAAEAQVEIAEMEETVKEVEDHRTLMTKLRELLSIDEKADLLESVGELQTKFNEITSKNVVERIGDLLKGKIKDDDARAAVLRLVPVSEMSGLDDEQLKVKVNEVMDTDETVKAIVNRFTGTPAPRTPKKVDVAEMGGDDHDDNYDSGKTTQHVRVGTTRM